MTPLYIAAKNGHVEIAKLLTNSGAIADYKCNVSIITNIVMLECMDLMTILALSI